MTTTTEAIFANGVLKPIDPLPFREHERVRITVESSETNGAVGPAANRRMIAGFDKMRLRTGGKLPTREELHDRS